MTRRTSTHPLAPHLELESSRRLSSEGDLQTRLGAANEAALHAFASPLSEQDDLAEFRDHLLIAISQADISGFAGTKQALKAMLKDVEKELRNR